MSSLKISGEGIAEFDNFQVKAIFLPLENSYLLLVSDQKDFGIGTVTLSSPSTKLGLDTLSTPFAIFGLKNSILANLIGKNASKKLNCPILSLLLIKEERIKQEIIIKTTMEAINIAIENIRARNSKN